MASLPKCIESIVESLDEQEIRDLARWYKCLRTPEKMNVKRFLPSVYEWGRTNLGDASYLLALAIGSSISRRDYSDVDFLLVGNKSWSEMNEQLRLGQVLEGDFKCVVETRHNFLYSKVFGSNQRTILRINPSVNGVYFHLSFQPEIPSEDTWNSIDKRQRIPIFRL